MNTPASTASAPPSIPPVGVADGVPLTRVALAYIDQRFDLVAANAVDLVVSQLITNERGVPSVHRVTLFPGQWMDGPGAPASAPA